MAKRIDVRKNITRKGLFGSELIFKCDIIFAMFLYKICGPIFGSGIGSTMDFMPYFRQVFK